MCHAHRSAPRRHPLADRRSPAKPPPPASFLSRPLRIGLSLALAGIVALVVGLLFWQRGSAGAADQTLHVTMGGFSALVVTARAGEPPRLRLVNLDIAFHADGGGGRQLAIPALGVDARVAPRSNRIVEIPAAAAGEDAFYRDVCRGGDENLSLQGTPRARA